MKDSTAMRMIRIAWDHNREATSHSWQRLNASMHKAVCLAIEAGLEFHPGDFTQIAETMRIGYWGGNDGHMCGEHFYSLAVEFRHPSAYQSFEQWKGRKPFIWENQRIHIGCRFTWEHRTVTCTSFSADGLSLIATERQYSKGSGYTVKRRFRITDADLRAARAARKVTVPRGKKAHIADRGNGGVSEDLKP